MRILVTGGSGQIGAALVPRLAALGAVVAPKRAELDFACPSNLAEQLDRIAPHLIINCAAYTNVDAAEDERDLASRSIPKARALSRAGRLRTVRY
jgi:dTDP-4-dehydrorhamnose reductase